MTEGWVKDDGREEIQHRLVELNVLRDVKNWKIDSNVLWLPSLIRPDFI